MDIETLRDFCLSLGGVTEKTPFGRFAARFDSILVFYVCGHMFCMFDLNDFSGVTVKGDPEKIAGLIETRVSCGSHRNMSPRYWIELKIGGDVTDSEIYGMIRRSHEIVMAKYSKPPVGGKPTRRKH